MSGNFNEEMSLRGTQMGKRWSGASIIQLQLMHLEFLRDVMQFLILRGHSPLAPQAGLSEFPDAILNAKRLDLYNLYREVVSRGGFHVGSGINWEGQVFSKMRNHTMANRMTGVGSGCWNIQCSGFVQVSTDYPIGMVLEPISVYQGPNTRLKSPYSRTICLFPLFVQIGMQMKRYCF